MSGRFLLVVVLAILAGSTFDSAFTAIVRVPTDQPTIQAGLLALAPFDTVLVDTGEYAEALISPAFTFWLIGHVAIDSGDFVRPVIDASLTPDTVHRGCLTLVNLSQGTIERIRFRNRYEIWHRGGVHAGGVYVEADTASFRDCAFDSTFGAVKNDSFAHPNARYSITGCTFYHNPFLTVWLNNARARVADCEFEGGTGFYQLLCGDSSVIENCAFSEAEMTAVCNWGVPFTIRNCVFGPAVTTYAYILLEGFRGVFENNIIAGLTLNADAMQVGVDCREEAVIQTNTFVNCVRVSNGPTHLLRITCDTTGTVPYQVRYNEVAACTTGQAPILSEGKGFFMRNRFHELRPTPAVMVVSDSIAGSTFRENLFWNNVYAMQTTGGGSVDARWNWWGDSTGPYNPNLNPNGQGDPVGSNIVFEPWLVDSTLSETADPTRTPLPESFTLSAYPNPFNSVVHFTLTPSEIGIYSLEIYDILGRKAAQVWSGPLAFRKDFTFDASGLSTGIYFARVSDALDREPLATAKLVLLK